VSSRFDGRSVTGQLPEHAEVVVVGAGLAGLAAARTLHRVGRDVVVVEASDGVGGRVRTDVVDGFQLDRGFQVLLTAYPEVRRQLDLPALAIQRFDPGALAWIDGHGHVVGDPFRRPGTLLSTLRAPIGTPLDKVRILAARMRVRRGTGADLLRGPDLTTIASLRKHGFSPRIIDRFFRPLFSGIQLDPALITSSRMFDVILRSMSEGDVGVPAAGMGAIPAQLAATLPAGRIVLDAAVAEVRPREVRLVDGRRISADVVIVATDGPQAAGLLGLRAVGSKAAGCVWFAADRAPVADKLVVLDSIGTGPVANVAVLSNVAPSYAPAGQALIAAAMPGVSIGDLEAVARAQLRGWWGQQVDAWRHLRTDRIAHGQPDGSPPFHPKKRVSLGDGLYVCGDHRDTASIQGALFSGRRCGEAVAVATA
jgi:phytoene dehydrogenase-like protein